MLNDFVGKSRDELINEIIRLRIRLHQVERQRESYSAAAEEHWHEEEHKRGEQGIFG